MATGSKPIWSMVRLCCGRPSRPAVRHRTTSRRAIPLPLTCPSHSRPRPPRQPGASRGGRERVKLPTSSPPLPSRSARVAGRRRLLCRRLHLLTARWPEASHGSCGAKRTCSRKRRVRISRRCPAAPLIGPRPRQATSSRSAVRFAMSRCASLDRDADTTGLADIPDPSPLWTVAKIGWNSRPGTSMAASMVPAWRVRASVSTRRSTTIRPSGSFSRTSSSTSGAAALLARQLAHRRAPGRGP